jgi:hypothetical protein
VYNVLQMGRGRIVKAVLFSCRFNGLHPLACSKFLKGKKVKASLYTPWRRMGGEEV